MTSAQAFESLRLNGRPVRRPDLTVATMDHNVPTREGPVRDPLARAQLDALRQNCEEFGVPLLATGNGREGIVHVIGPELGLTQPGMTIVCGDSHTSTHGALGSLAFGIGTSEVEHVLATQCLPQVKPKTIEIRYVGARAPGVTAKDMVLATIGQIGVAGGTGHVLEYRGDAISELSMDGRMTICNMSIEGGARAGLIAPDDTTFAYLEGRPGAPSGAAWEAALDEWRELRTDDGAAFDRTRRDRPGRSVAAGHVGHEPRNGHRRSRRRPRSGPARRRVGALGGRAGARLHGARARHADPRDRARPRLHRLVHERAPRGSARRRARSSRASRWRAASRRSSSRARRRSGARRRRRGSTASSRRRASSGGAPGCSMCLGMNDDVAAPGERVASTSNRNFEGRQGAGARTHLVSPEMAAAAAIAGHFVDVREVLPA